MIKWIRPSGRFIETNDANETVEYAESLGWARAEAIDEDSEDNGCHVSAVNGMDSKDEIIQYLNDINIDIDTKGNLVTTRKRAIEAIEDDNSIADSKRGD